MAVIQISKIQQRRGQRLVSGMPQLSSAELAWAVDTQELFIGNGSIAEGAPYVGNTRILTERDNILELAESYRFANNNLSVTTSVPRPLQNKIDEIQVSVLDFGPVPDPSTDQTPMFDRAFAALFQNTDTNLRKVLVVPNGTYVFKSVLRIPSNVILRGETKDQAILDINSNGIEFLSAAGTDALGFTSTDRPENIVISNLTISHTTTGTNLTGVKGSTFDNVKFTSEYVLGDDVATPISASQAYDLSDIADGGYITISGNGVATLRTVTWAGSVTSTIEAVAVEVNANLSSTGTTLGLNAYRLAGSESLVIESPTASAAEIAAAFISGFGSEIKVYPTGNPTVFFRIVPTATQASAGIENVNAAVYWTNIDFGTRVTDVHFIECSFNSVALGIRSIQTFLDGETDIELFRCSFFVCDTGVYVKGFGNTQKANWRVNDCHWEEIAKQAFISTAGVGTNIHRARLKNVGNGVNDARYPETPMFEFGTLYGNSIVDCFSDRHQAAGVGVDILSTTVGIPEAVNVDIQLSNSNYSDIYLSDTFTPLAVFGSTSRWITIDYILTLSDYVRKGLITMVLDGASNIAIADNYTYSPSFIKDPGGTMMTNFEFNAELKDNDADSGIETVMLSYKNPLATGATGTISYNISYGV